MPDPYRPFVVLPAQHRVELERGGVYPRDAPAVTSFPHVTHRERIEHDESAGRRPADTVDPSPRPDASRDPRSRLERGVVLANKIHVLRDRLARPKMTDRRRRGCGRRDGILGTDRKSPTLWLRRLASRLGLMVDGTPVRVCELVLTVLGAVDLLSREMCSLSPPRVEQGLGGGRRCSGREHADLRVAGIKSVERQVARAEVGARSHDDHLCVESGQVSNGESGRPKQIDTMRAQIERIDALGSPRDEQTTIPVLGSRQRCEPLSHAIRQERRGQPRRRASSPEQPFEALKETAIDDLDGHALMLRDAHTREARQAICDVHLDRQSRWATAAFALTSAAPRRGSS